MKKLILLSTLVLSLSACSGSDSEKIGLIPPTVAPAPIVVPAPIVTPPTNIADYIGFESAPVRPIAQTDDGNFLLVTNTSNNSLEIYRIDSSGTLTHQQSLPVGLEPVSVAINSNKAWVVNHLSDSISIVDLSGDKAFISRTLLVGDEPRDIVFAKGKAFITTAHRGQQRESVQLSSIEGAGDSQLHTPGTARADIWVFGANDLGEKLGGTPTKIISLFGDTARSLAVTPDGSTIYAAVLNSGNQTTVVHENVMCHGFEDDTFGAHPCQVMDGITSPNGIADGYLPGGRTAPGTNSEGKSQPWTSMIVKYDNKTGQWRDTKGRNFSNAIRFTLPDKDVFAINTSTLTETASFTHVGTTLFNMAVSPTTGEIFITNTEANNETRFEGPGVFGGSTVQGNIAKSRITVINPQTGEVKPRHLNRHIDYSMLKANEETKKHSLSNPTQIGITTDGSLLYTTVIGSNKVAVLPTNQLVKDSYWDNKATEFDPTSLSKNYFTVPGGPVGLLLNEQHKQLYVFTRFDNSIVALNINNGIEIQRLAMKTPDPTSFSTGRFMLYDANRSSSNGESSCGSCHVFGDTDHLSWNLGNPDASNGVNPQPFPRKNFLKLGCFLVGPKEDSCQLLDILNGDGKPETIAAMKGPMTTQTMRGMNTHGHMHWRGDRSVGYFGTDEAQTLDERLSFKNFIVAFEGLLGMDIDLPTSVDSTNKSGKVITLEQDIDKFADFMLKVALPPNPIRSLDNSMSVSAQLGDVFFHGKRRSDGTEIDFPANGDSVDGVNCAGCHTVDHAKGFYGTGGDIAHGGEIQILKVPQLRNLYTRVGMFGLPDRGGFLPSHTKSHQGEQIRGFGFLHDGGTDQLLNFLKGGVFDNGEEGCPEGANESHGCLFNEGVVGIPDEKTRQGLVDYMMEFDNDLAPIVGQQITLNEASSTQVNQRLTLLEQRAKTPFISKILGGEVTECDLIATGIINGVSRGYLLITSEDAYRSDDSTDDLVEKGQLRMLAQQANNSLTFTCAVPGRGWQMSLDSDLNGILNANEES